MNRARIFTLLSMIVSDTPAFMRRRSNLEILKREKRSVKFSNKLNDVFKFHFDSTKQHMSNALLQSM